MDPIDCIIVYAPAAWTKEGSCTCTRTTASASRVMEMMLIDTFDYATLIYTTSIFLPSSHLSLISLEQLSTKWTRGGMTRIEPFE
jgi:hypothetical protein